MKYRPGGLVDVEFTAQYLQLASGGGEAPVFSANTGQALDRLRETGVLSEAAHADLRTGLGLWRRLQIALRLTAAEKFDAETAPEGQRRLLVRIAGAADFEDLTATMEAQAEAVSARYSALVGEPAARARDRESAEGTA